MAEYSMQKKMYSQTKTEQFAPQKISFKNKLLLGLLGLICVLLTVAYLAPAAWFGLMLERASQGRLALGDAQGSLWHGSAVIGAAAKADGDVAPLLPGRFEWRLSPIILLGQIDLSLNNPESLQQPLNINGNLWHAQFNPSGIILPADRLAALGAPLNTVRPTGRMTLSWDALSVSWQNAVLEVNGTMVLHMQDIASSLSPVKPLGSYAMHFNWHETKADIDLLTERGPLLLTGKGSLKQGRLQFSGQASAEDGQEDKLINLLNLLGQRRAGASKAVIALEFN